MLDANVQARVRAYLEKIQQPIELIASLDDSDHATQISDLLDDLACRKVPEQAELGRQAKITFERAAALGRKTDRVAIFGRKIDGFHRPACGGLDQISACAVNGDESRFDRHLRDIGDLGELCTKGLREIRDLVE